MAFRYSPSPLKDDVNGMGSSPTTEGCMKLAHRYVLKQGIERSCRVVPHRPIQCQWYEEKFNHNTLPEECYVANTEAILSTDIYYIE